MEAPLRRLMFEYDGQIRWRYCQGGLLPAWTNYNDAINSVTRPLQMGPLWMHAQEVSGMPVDATIWKTDPPASSYPSCIAVKCAALQSAEAGERYLRMVREAVMMEAKNISQQQVLIDIATAFATKNICQFDIEKFKADLINGNGREAFRKDLQEKQLSNIDRFPTLVIKSSSHHGIIVTGYRPYDILHEAVLHVCPTLPKTNGDVTESKYISFWGNLTKREVEEINR